MQVPVDTLPDPEARKNGILALMKKCIRLNGIYLLFHLERSFDTCMDQLETALKDQKGEISKEELNNILFTANLDGKKVINSTKFPDCAKLPTLDHQFELMANHPLPAKEVGANLAILARKSKPLIHASFNVAKERDARKKIEKILTFLEGVKPGYKAANDAFKLENGADFPEVERGNIYKTDWQKANAVHLQ